MKVEFMFGTHFISEKMAIDFLKIKNHKFRKNENVYSANIQVHHNKENSPLYITFQTSWENKDVSKIKESGYVLSGGGNFLECPFIDYYNWFEENKSKYFTKEFFNNHMSNLLSV